MISSKGPVHRRAFSFNSEPRMATPKRHWTTAIGQAAGHPAAFAVVLVYALLWLTFDPVTFDWNAVATLAVWVMTLFIQRSNRRDTLALHAKLDELLRAHGGARSELARLDEQEPEDIERHRDAEVRKTSAEK
jgi:low affinity Fe/Cu permease